MKKVQRTLAAALAAMMLMPLAGCSKGNVTKEVNSGLSDLKAQAAEPAVEPQTETPGRAQDRRGIRACIRTCIGARCRAGAGSYRRAGPCFRSCRKSRLSIGRWPEYPDFGGVWFGLYAGAQRDLPRQGLVQVRDQFRGFQAVPD